MDDTAGEGYVYVADAARRQIQVFSTSGVHEQNWGGDQYGFLTLMGIAVDRDGYVYVSDAAPGNPNVQKFFPYPDGNFFDGNWVSPGGSPGTGDGQFGSVIGGLAVDGAGNIYVADTGNNRVQKFAPDGSFVMAWGSLGTTNGQFNGPTGVAVHGGTVYVADRNNRRVQLFDLDGNHAGTWTGPSEMPFNAPWGIATDASGNVYVSDEGKHVVHVLDATGEIQARLGTYGVTGTEAGKFRNPRGIVVDTTGSVYVVDRMNNRVQKFVPADGPSARANGPYAGSEGTAVTFSAAGSTGSAGTEITNYEWDFGSDGAYEVSVTTPEVPLTWYNDFAGTATLRVTDAKGNTATDTATVAISNVAPYELGLSPGATTIDEGSAFAATGTFRDPGADTWTVSIDYGDGSTEQVRLPDGERAFSLSHEYGDNGAYPVAVTVSDGEETVSQTVDVTVNNVAPFDLGLSSGATTIDEGSTFTATAAFLDPGADTWTASVDYGDGSGVQEITVDRTFGLSHRYHDNGQYHVNVVVTDDDGGTSPGATIDVTVDNIAPDAVTTADDATIAEGDTFTGYGSFSDPGSDQWTATVDYGDGSGEQVLALAADKTFALNHVYRDDDEDDRYTVTVVVTDDDGGSDTSTVDVAVINVDPVIESIDVPLCPPMTPVRVNTPISASVTFSDPGTLDTHTITWNWGDGSESDVSSESDASGALTVTTTHAYATPGIYSPSVTVTDKDDSTYTLEVPETEHIVVYDPDAGSATGGGWFDSPSGTYMDQPALTGKAHFAFVSRYGKDATVPDSSVEFRFKPADLDFKSTSCDWLVVAGSKTTYRGVGTLNGAVGYGFLLSATDVPSGDLIRMKIWELASGDVVYDTLPGAPDAADPSLRIGAGSIVIHQ